MVDDDKAAVPPHDAQDERVGSAAPLDAGTRVGKYEIVAVLGQGSFGITYYARDTQLGRDVAIKEYLPTAFAVRAPDSMVLPRSTPATEDFRWGRQRFLDEARTLAQLEAAPGIVNVSDFLEANGTAYMVMALVGGETLEARLRRDRTLPPADIERLLHPLLDGLERLHDAGFQHHDIKPANILIDRTGQPTLIDFGAARTALQERTQAPTAADTPGYAAFEQVTSAGQGPWTDIYALGATLYHCITGSQPPDAIERAKTDPIVPAAEAGTGRYPARLLAGIDAALRVDAGDRPRTVADWRRLMFAGSDAAGAAAATGQTTRRRRRLVGMAAAAVLVLGLAGGGTVWWQRAQEDQAWARATAADTDAAYRDYLAAYPKGRYEAQARKAVADVEARAALRAEDEAWSRARGENTPTAYRTYLAAWPGGRHAGDARQAIAALEADAQAWARAAALHSEEAYRAYLADHPGGQHAANARTAIADLAAAREAEAAAWESARIANTVAALRTYLERYGSGRHADEARALLARIEHDEQVAAAQRVEDEAWESARTANTAAALRTYLERHGSGRHADDARALLARIEHDERTAAAQRADDEAWSRARAENTPAAYATYLAAWPGGRHADDARQATAALEADAQAWARAAALHTEESYRAYLADHPGGQHAAAAGKAIGELAAARQAEAEAWESAKAASTVAALRTYLNRYGSGRHADDARALLARLEREQQTTAAQRAEDEAWESAKAANSVAALRTYLNRYGSGRHADDARALLARLEREQQTAAARRAEAEAWSRAKTTDTEAGYEDFVARYPASARVAEARQAIEAKWEARWRAALTASQAGKVDAAIGALQAMVRERPERIDAAAVLGDLLRNKERFAEAVTAYDTALARLPVPENRHWGLFYGRALALERIDQWARAESDFLRALSLLPARDPDARTNRGYVLNYLGYTWVEKGVKLKEALALLKEAAELAPDDGAVTDSLAWAHYRLGQYQQAVALLEKAVRQKPDAADILEHLGDAYWHVDRRPEASQQWERALQKDPEPSRIAILRRKLAEGLTAELDVPALR